MGLREVTQDFERDEIRALPYALKDIRAENTQPVHSKPPRVYPVPESWVGKLFMAAFLAMLLFR